MRRRVPLAEQLAKLREQLGRPTYRVDTPLPDLYDRLRNLGGENGHLRCANCRRDGSSGADGWTLQLGGDNQLHTFCRDCYEREFGRVA